MGEKLVYNMVMTLPSEHLKRLLTGAIARAYPEIAQVDITIDPTKDIKFGDYTSPVAMQLSKMVHQPAPEVAHHILAQLGKVSMLNRAEIAGPGFINFFVEPKWLMQQTAKILADKTFGRNLSGKNQKIVVEFISANPTGPMTLGNGRGAFSGDTMANVLALSGWQVRREYYINDIGKQVDILAESVLRRYWQQQGIKTEYPEYCYQGEYVSELAQKAKLHMYNLQSMPALREKIKGRVVNLMITDAQRVVAKKLKINFDQWVRESSLYVRKLDQKTLEVLRSHDLLYEKEGATWFRTTAFGDDKDRVLIKNDGEKAYFLSDIALRYNRFAQRGFDRELIFLGADHHGYIGRLEAAMAALGYAKRLDVAIVQLVRLLKDGQEVKMSKRAGTYVTLEEVVDEVGLDVARFFFLMHAPETHMDFNMNLAKEHSEKNPVFYVQYAYARINSILLKTKKLPTKKNPDPPQPSELALVKALLEFPNVVADVAVSRETQKLPFYAMDLATKFHDFYTNCRVIDQDAVLPDRLLLIKTVRHVLAKTLGVMGITAPEKM